MFLGQHDCHAANSMPTRADLPGIIHAMRHGTSENKLADRSSVTDV